MKIYSVTFRKYDDYNKKTIVRQNKGKQEKINLPEGGTLLVPEFDLLKYSTFGEGYQSVNFVGEMDDLFFLSGSKEHTNKAIEASVSNVIGHQDNNAPKSAYTTQITTATDTTKPNKYQYPDY
jgi:hypothetical protein